MDQHGRVGFGTVPEGPWRDLLVSVVSDGFLTTFSYEQGRAHFVSRGHGSSPTMASDSGIAGESRLERSIVLARVGALDQLLQGSGDVFRLTHPGRVRLSELKQALRSGREREPLGILWAVRHWEQDLQVALLDASVTTPVSVAYLDMNGLKALNDQFGHDVGDEGLRAYFQAVASVLGDTGEAYRLGGDEVVVILPGRDATAAAHLTQLACRRLMGERIGDHKTGVFLSIAAGIVCVTDSRSTPAAVRAAADKVQYRAKEESRKVSARPSVIAIEGVDRMHVIAG